MAAQGEPQVQFKLVLLGNGAIGKTMFVKCHLTGPPLVFHTNRGPIKFNVWETAIQEKFGRTCLIGIENLVHVCENILIVLCGNKVDTKDRKGKAKSLKSPSWLARKLIRDAHLEFVAMPALAPPEVVMARALAAQYECDPEAI
ncbi:unnamed protein product [Nyctereutes procyonoides]|uniref:(raccoon dog) hypothetical protein n=1 Tax=Nyctereutes procyonoides TaxID=34880 RepID=A0A811Z0D9_NYCPR|nr:unnamed protein product [Nyctereutes procyonoides]